MSYVVDFCVASLIYLGVISFFYFYRRRTPDISETLYRIMLVLGLCSLTLDLLCAVGDMYAALVPAPLLYAGNILFLGCVQASGTLLLFYTMSLVGSLSRLSRLKRALLLLPACLSSAVILLSPFGRFGAFFIEENHSYRHGASHLVLYAVVAFYLAAAAFSVLSHARAIRRRKLYTILAFEVITLIAMGVQLRYPQYLVNSTANALAVAMMYFALQTPSEHVDALTGCFNRASLPILLKELAERGARYTLLLFPLTSIAQINRALGTEAGDGLIKKLASLLGAQFPEGELVRVSGGTLAVLLPDGEPCGREAARAHLERLQADMEHGGEPVSAVGRIAAINSEDCSHISELPGIMDELISRLSYDRGEPVLLLDREYQERSAGEARIEAAVDRAIREETVEVYYQPIHWADGRLAALEALCRIRDPELGFISPEVFIPLTEKNGSVQRLGALVLRQVCAFLAENDAASWGLHHVGVNLSIVQCMSTDLPRRISEIVEPYAIPRGLLSFEITETEAATEISQVSRNMQALSSAGFAFLLDDFGSGYANFDYLMTFPFTCIKLDKYLLWDSDRSPEQRAFFEGSCRILKRLGLLSVCEGVETREQIRELQELGVTMHQGYYYAKALPPDELLAYVAAAREKEGGA